MTGRGCGGTIGGRRGHDDDVRAVPERVARTVATLAVSLFQRATFGELSIIDKQSTKKSTSHIYIWIYRL